MRATQKEIEEAATEALGGEVLHLPNLEVFGGR